MALIHQLKFLYSSLERFSYNFTSILMAIKRKSETIVNANVTLGQLIGTGITLLTLIAISYVNLQIKVNNSEVRQQNTDATVAEIKNSIHEIQVTQTVILEKLGGLTVKVEYLQKQDTE